ncbi:MAG: STAS domain-containing protein [Leptolyngbyaceae cyanobacterium]
MSSIGTSVKVVRPVGALTAATAETFKAETFTAITSGSSTEIVIDMAAVDSVDSSGLVAVIASCNAAKRHRKRLSLCHVAPAVRIVFELAQLDRALSMAERQELQAA